MSTSPMTARLIAEGRGLPDHLETKALFGQVMALVALTIGFTATGAYVGRDLGGGWGLAAFVLALVAVLGLNVAATRSPSLALTMLFALGLLLGLALGPGLAAITAADPAAVWQAAGATALFTAALGSFGWATRRDLCREHLPRRPQRVPVLPAALRRRQGRVATAAARSTWTRARDHASVLTGATGRRHQQAWWRHQDETPEAQTPEARERRSS